MCLLVIVPICLLEGILLVSDSPAWMRGSAGLVIAVSVIALARGYLRRLEISPSGVVFRRLVGRIEIPWQRVRSAGKYRPGGGVGGREYVYVSSRDGPPLGKWDIDAETVQAQDRPGLWEAIEQGRAGAGVKERGL
jgi:hypothetical protein